MPDVFRIAEVLVSHANRVHPGEVGIIAYYGSYAKGQASPTSDLDLFYMPDEGKARSLCTQFVIDGRPYDFWPVSWQMAEEIANADSERPWAVSASLIADSQVLYHRSQEDLERFNGLKARIQELTEPVSKSYMVERALREFKNTLFQLGQMRLANDVGDNVGLQWAAWNLAGSAVNCLALVNQTYFSKGWGANMSQILAMVNRPADLGPLLRDVYLPRKTAVALTSADRLTKEVRTILQAAQRSVAEVQPVDEVFQDFYFYVIEYKGKTLAACERGDEIAAVAAAYLLQEQICQFMSKTVNGFYPAAYNLFSEYSGGYDSAGLPDLMEPASLGDLDELAVRARLLDERFKEWLNQYNVDLNVLADEDELPRFLDRRDPQRAD